MGIMGIRVLLKSQEIVLDTSLASRIVATEEKVTGLCQAKSLPMQRINVLY
jgi:hypothetical protein